MVNFAQLMKNVHWQAGTTEPRPAGQSTYEDAPPVRDEPPREGSQAGLTAPAVMFPQRPFPEDDRTRDDQTQSVEAKLSAVEKLSALLGPTRVAGEEGIAEDDGLEAGSDDRGVDIDRLADDIVANLAGVIASAPPRDESERPTAGAGAPCAESPQPPAQDRAVAEPAIAPKPDSPVEKPAPPAQAEPPAPPEVPMMPAVPAVSMEAPPQPAVEPPTKAVELAKPAQEPAQAVSAVPAVETQGPVRVVPAALARVEPVVATGQAEAPPPVTAGKPTRETPPLNTDEDIEKAFSSIASAVRVSSDQDGRAVQEPQNVPPEAETQAARPVSAKNEGPFPDAEPHSAGAARQAQAAFKPIEETRHADFKVVEGSSKPVSPAEDRVVPGDMTERPQQGAARVEAAAGTGGPGVPAQVPEPAKTPESEGGIERQNILDEMMKIINEIGPPARTAPADGRPAGVAQPSPGADAGGSTVVPQVGAKTPEVPAGAAAGTRTDGPVAMKQEVVPARATPADLRPGPESVPVTKPRTSPAEPPVDEAPAVPESSPITDADAPAGGSRSAAAVAGVVLYLPKAIIRVVMEFAVALGEGLFGGNSVFARVRSNMDFVASVMTCLVGIVWFISATVSSSPWISLGLGAVFFVPSFGWLLMVSMRGIGR